jgi:response regulator RpfG family c-di-GMP phosphodiesterase
MRSIGAVTFVWTNGLLGVILYLVVSRVHDEVTRRAARPEMESLRRAADQQRAQHAVIFGLTKLAAARDGDTGEHLDRISRYSTALAWALKRRGAYREIITPTFVQYLGISSALHDIGKVGVEDAILQKPGKLTPDERRRMQAHANIGADCLKEIERRLGSSNFLRMAREIASFHHERWDGLGYPEGLAGDDIPLAARIVAVADVYDALASERVYKAALPHAECVEIIRRESGKQFDPQVVDGFLEIEGMFRDIAPGLTAATKPENAVALILEDVNRSLPNVVPQPQYELPLEKA